ncbi:MAG: acyl-CoA dehydrogenase family protein [Thermoleophilaceae bacterium]
MQRTIFEDEHTRFRESVSGFLTREAAPRTAAWQAEGIIDRDFWRCAAAQGLVGLSIPERFGGSGIDDFRFNAVLNEEVVHTGTTTDAFALTNDVLAPYLVELTTDEQKERWLPGVAQGELVPAIAMTEPGAGSDLRAIRTTAVRKGDHYEVTGSKTFVTSGIQADLIIVAAQVQEPNPDVRGLGLFVVEAGMQGFVRGRKLEKVGRRAQDTAELFFDCVRVPVANVLGLPGKGLSMLMRNLPQERLSAAVTAVASATRAFDITLAYAKQRRAFGQSIGQFQANKFALAEMSTELAVGRTFVDRCIQAHTKRELTPAEAAGVKYWATEMEFRTIDRCVQLHGGYGYMEEYEIARLWRDSRVQRIYGGTTEIMKEIIGRSLGL